MTAFRLLTGALLFAYPLAVFAGLTYWGVAPLAVILFILFFFRMAVGSFSSFVTERPAKTPVFSGPLKYLSLYTGVIGVILVSLSALFKEATWFLYYPVAVNAVLLCIFSFSLRQPQSLVEQFAGLQDPHLNTKGIAYTRKVTQVWCLFFCFNGAVALATCSMPLSYWTLYNGFISYFLIGLLFAIELFIRKKVHVS